MDTYEFVIHFKRLREDREQEAKKEAMEMLLHYKMMAIAIHSDAQSFVDSIDKSIAESEGTYNAEVGDINGLMALKAELEGKHGSRK